MKSKITQRLTLGAHKNIFRALIIVVAAWLTTNCSNDTTMAPPDPVNSRPIADAGSDRSVTLADTVTLDGRGSSDRNGDALTYLWSLIDGPNASNASLSDAAAVMPTLVADELGTFAAELVVNDGTLDSAPDTIEIVVTELPNISLFSRTIGAALQHSIDATLGEADHGGVTLRVQSNNPSLLLVAPDHVTPGSEFIDFDVPDGVGKVRYTVQGVAGAIGVATVTASAPGFNDGNGTIDVVQPGIHVTALATTQSVGTDDLFWALIGIPNVSGTGLSSTQGVSAGNVPPLVMTVSSSNGTVAHVALAGNSGATIEFDLAADESRSTVGFKPLASGATTVSASMPGFLSIEDIDITVDEPGLSVFSRTIGAGLQRSGSANLDINDHGGVTLRIESDDPSVARIAPDATTPGADFIDFFVPNGTDHVEYVVQGVAGSEGTVTVTGSIPGFTNGTGTIEIVQPGVSISNLDIDLSVGVNDVFTVSTGVPNSTGTGLNGFQGMSAGNITPLAITISSSDGGVGHLALGLNTGPTITFDLNATEFQKNVTFVTSGTGVTTVSATIPGFASFGTADVDVEDAHINILDRTIGAGLQYNTLASLDVSDHGGVTVRVESDDPVTALVAPDANTPGSSFIDVFVDDGDDFAPFTVQGVAGATGIITVTASAPGFTDGTGTFNIVQPVIQIFGLTENPSVGVNDVFTLFIGPTNGGGGTNGLQGASAANIPPLVVTVTSSDGAVGTISAVGNTGATITFDLTAGMFQPSVTFQSVAAGSTSVTATIPGFISLPGAVGVTVEP